MKKLLMEFLGTFFFIFTIAMASNPIAIACMLMAWVYIGGYISGAHYNPAVTLAVAVRGRIDWLVALYYMAAQVLGGFAAFAITGFLRGGVMIPAPGAGVTLLQAFIVEILLAFVLAFVVLVVATSEKFRTSHIFGFAIGFTIPALAALGSPISGGLFNPAIALGAHIYGAIIGAPLVAYNLPMYVGGALLGGFLAGCAFKFFFMEYGTERPVVIVVESK